MKVSNCPAHCADGLYKAIRTNRRILGLPPQDCTCELMIREDYGHEETA